LKGSDDMDAECKKIWEKAQILARENCSSIYDCEWEELDKFQREDCVFYYYEELLKERDNDMNTKLICPNCGTEMKLPEKSEVVTGMTLSKETGGTHVLQADVIKNDNLNSTKLNNKENKKMNNKENRMETLKVNGIEVGKYFDVTLPNGGTVRMTLENGVPVVANDDPIVNQIIEDGYVRNSKLHRRFVMAQMFKMLNYVSGWENGYDACLRNRYPYHYQFTMMLEEIRVISKLEQSGDIETFKERTSFFDKDVVTTVCTHYVNDLEDYVNNLKEKKCKGVPYKRVPKYGDIFVVDLDKKLYHPFMWLISTMKHCTDYADLYRKLNKFVNMMIRLPYDTRKSKVWIDAFKGSGAFYTLKNLTMYHGCKIVDEQYNGWNQPRKVTTYMAGMEATNFAKSKLNEYKGEGWRYLAMLRKCIADNNFSFEQRMEEIYNK